jgi:hypothetical protein
MRNTLITSFANPQFLTCTYSLKSLLLCIFLVNFVSSFPFILSRAKIFCLTSFSQWKSLSGFSKTHRGSLSHTWIRILIYFVDQIYSIDVHP